MHEVHGYDGFEFIDLNELEQTVLEQAAQTFEQAIVEAGFSQQTADRLTLDFGKAVLTIDEDSRRSGAWHQLQGGDPFYRIELTLEGSSMESLMTMGEAETLFFHLAMNMPPFQGSSSMSMGSPVYVNQDFNDASIGEKAALITEAVKVLGEMKQTSTGAYAPSMG